jgi:hypothetical protein
MRLPQRVLFHRTKLSPLALRAFLLRTLQRADRDDDYTAAECFLLWTAVHLNGIGCLQEDQRHIILDEMRRAGVFSQMPADAAPFGPGVTEYPNLQLVLADGKYATWTGSAEFLDLETGEYIARLPQPVLESLGCNLTELFRRNAAVCQRVMQSSEVSADATVEQP